MSMDEEEASPSEDLPLVQNIETCLRALLDKAQQIKQTNNVEPPLPTSEFETSVLSITLDSTEGSQSSQESVNLPFSRTPVLHVALETAARNLFYPLITTIPIADPGFVAVWNLLDILQLCADHSQCDPSLPLRHVEELLDSQTIEGCRYVFDYMESRRERLMGLPLRYASGTSQTSSAAKGEENGATPSQNTSSTKKERDTLLRNKEMIVLRSCNELLRRLSRAEDTVFCGRVFMFLFQSFELGNKASVNLRGEFHTENVTKFDDIEEKPQSSENDEMDVDGSTKLEEAREDKPVNGEIPTIVEPGVEKATDTKIAAEADAQIEDDIMDTDKLYTSFWSLQNVFSNPTTLFSTDAFAQFKTGLDLTLKKFKSMTKVLQTHGIPKTPAEGIKTLKRKRTRDGDEFASNFNPKYLTSRDLFELETLIIIDFLTSLTPKAKAKVSTLKAQKAMLYPYTLSEADTKWAVETRARIATYLQEGPDGKFYYRMADTVLTRDKNWVRWKIESCPPISMAPVSTAEHMEAARGAKRLCLPRRIKANPMGAIDMRFVSDTYNVNGLETLRNPQRCHVPKAEKWVEEVERIDLDLEMAGPNEEEYLKEGRTTALWRASRVAARTKINLLEKIDEGEGLKVLRDTTGDEDADIHVEETGDEKANADLNAEGTEAETEADVETSKANGTESSVSRKVSDGDMEMEDSGETSKTSASREESKTPAEVEENLNSTEEELKPVQDAEQGSKQDSSEMEADETGGSDQIRTQETSMETQPATVEEAKGLGLGEEKVVMQEETVQ